MRRLALLLFCVGTTAVSCANNPTPHAMPSFSGVVAPYEFGVFMMRFIPPPEYERWMEDVERCSGIERDPDHDDTFWLVPRRFLHVNAAHDSATVAEHDWKYHQIRFGIGWELDSNIVRHELLHHLLSVKGDQIDHDPKYYRVLCRREIGG